jgi:hypothetical protein
MPIPSFVYYSIVIVTIAAVLAKWRQKQLRN